MAVRRKAVVVAVAVHEGRLGEVVGRREEWRKRRYAGRDGAGETFISGPVHE